MKLMKVSSIFILGLSMLFIDSVKAVELDHGVVRSSYGLNKSLAADANVYLSSGSSNFFHGFGLLASTKVSISENTFAAYYAAKQIVADSLLYVNADLGIKYKLYKDSTKNSKGKFGIYISAGIGYEIQHGYSFDGLTLSVNLNSVGYINLGVGYTF